ncbi:MAG: hypothetical protein DRN27_08035 [Thermoplasmata archaeon]|nr:MAG: hypothetical protein DRN27_08035 [Thermoplasmata archaeon]
MFDYFKEQQFYFPYSFYPTHNFVKQKINVQIKASILSKMFDYVDCCDIEIEGFATSNKVEKVDVETYLIYDILPLFKQVANNTHVETSTTDIAEWMETKAQKISDIQQKKVIYYYNLGKIKQACNHIDGLTKKNIDQMVSILRKKHGDINQLPLPSSMPANINVHWHSHVNMSTIWSGQDHKNALNLSKSFGCKYVIAIVLNMNRENRVKFIDSKRNLIVDDIPLEVIEDRSHIVDIKKEIKNKVFRESDGYYMNQKTDIIEKQQPKPYTYYNNFYNAKPTITSIADFYKQSNKDIKKESKEIISL